MACVHPDALQLFQKLVESMPGPGSERSVGGEGEEERRDMQVVSGGAGEMAELVQGGEPVTLRGLE